MLTKLLLSPVPGSRKMEYKGNSWHETCFLCHRCQQPIGTKSFIPKDAGYFCVPCFEKQFAYQCCACKKVGLQLTVVYLLTAAVNPPDSGIVNITYTECDCVKKGCLERLMFVCVCMFFHPCLGICYFQAITTGGVTYQEKPWHRECFLCIGCRKQLSGQRFTSRENFPYCLECFSNLYAKKCVGCTKPITSESPAALMLSFILTLLMQFSN